MNAADYIHSLCLAARNVAMPLARLSTEEKNVALMAFADALDGAREPIFAANERDVENARIAGISSALLDRLTLTNERFDIMVAGVRHVASLADPVGAMLFSRTRPSGITIRKVRVPIGVIAVIFESRPNVFVDTAVLCFKAGNAVILRGGKEAVNTNRAFMTVVEKSSFPKGAIQFVNHLSHSCVTSLVRAVGLVDLAIPRGGERLIKAVCENAYIPVLKHYKGVCHLYVDDRANLDMAMKILNNAKIQRPGVCNAVECLLVNEKIAPKFLPRVNEWAEVSGVRLHHGAKGVEFLSLNLNVELVSDFKAAIDFINTNSSHHSDAIVTDDYQRAAAFMRDVDSAVVYHNVSTRFTDGAEFGMGAEIGISTDKLHARGPMGLEELTTYKYQITGNGIIR